MAEGTFQLIEVETDYAFEFPFFPENVSISGGANWNPQETTQGVKPLMYANTEPTRISLTDIHLDETMTGVSLKPTLDLLRMFKNEVAEGGPPPAILALWGDEELLCVMTGLDIEQIMFNPEGECIRARLQIELLELQPEGESTTVEVGS